MGNMNLTKANRTHFILLCFCLLLLMLIDYYSMDWFKGKPTGNHRFYHQIMDFLVKNPLNQSIELLTIVD